MRGNVITGLDCEWRACFLSMYRDAGIPTFCCWHRESEAYSFNTFVHPSCKVTARRGGVHLRKKEKRGGRRGLVPLR